MLVLLLSDFRFAKAFFHFITYGRQTLHTHKPGTCNQLSLFWLLGSVFERALDRRFSFRCFCARVAERSDNFIIGLTNLSPAVTAPTLWNYALCGQYPGAVAAGATVSLVCSPNLQAYRYVIVQFPITEMANFCELEVYIRRKFHAL